MRKFLFLSCIFIFTFAACLFAAENTGVLGNMVLGFFEKILKVSPETAFTIYSTCIILLMIVIRVVLKKVPGGPEGFIGRILWKIASILFGDGVRLENNTDSAYVKEQLKKKYQLLNIEIK